MVISAPVLMLLVSQRSIKIITAKILRSLRKKKL